MPRFTMWALSCAWLFSCSAVLAQPRSSTQVIPLKLYGQHLIVVQGSIGSLEKRNLVIDTGAYPSIIDRRVAKKLHLFGPRLELDAVTQTVQRTAVVVPAVEVGPIHVTELHGLVDDLSNVSQQFGVRIDALIGLDVLSGSSFRIDYAARKIFFGPVASLPFSAPFERVDSMICLGLQAGRQTLRLLIDTGAERTLLLGPRVSELSAHSERSREFTNLAGHFSLREISLERLQLGETDLAAQPIFLLDAANLPPYHFDGFLSTAQFRQIAFDFERREFSWMTNDDRVDRVRVASDSSIAPAYVAIWAERAAKANPSTEPEYCATGEVPGVSCGLR
jgi:predicted aspartyl protease